MNLPFSRAAILVSVAMCAWSCAQPVTRATTSPASVQKIAELWEMPADIRSRDLFHGAGGPELVPKGDVPHVWIATDATGYSPGYDVRGLDGRSWSVKLGPEAQSEVVASRVLWAIGYHQPPTYHLVGWRLSGGPGGEQPEARFRADVDGARVIGDWSWSDNAFIGARPYHGLIAANVLLNSWDWKTSNNKIYRHSSGAHRYVVRDLGASLGKTSPSRLFGLIPLRGFGQGSRNDVDGFEAQRYITRAGENDIDFDFHTIYGSVVDLVTPSDVRWTAELLNQLTDAQWDDAFRAANYTPEVRRRYIKKIKAKIAEGLAVS